MKPRRPAGRRTFPRPGLPSLVLACACACVLASAPRTISASAPPASSAQVNRRVHVTVTGDKGAAAPGLTPADFEVKEDGRTCPVLEVAQPTRPVSVAVLLDDRGSDINEIRAALAVFVTRVQGRAEVSLVSVVPTPLTIFEYTLDPANMIAGIRRLVWRSGPAGGLILGAIADAADELKRREADRAAIVVVTFEGEEYRSHRPASAVLASLERSRAALHVVAVGTPTLRKMNRAAVESGNAQGDDWIVDHNNRNAVLGDGPKQSGGRRQEITVASGLNRCARGSGRRSPQPVHSRVRRSHGHQALEKTWRVRETARPDRARANEDCRVKLMFKSVFAILAFVAAGALQAAPQTPAPAANPHLVVYKGDKGPGAGKHIVFLAGDEEYRSEETLPALARILARHYGFTCSVFFTTDPSHRIHRSRQVEHRRASRR